MVPAISGGPSEYVLQLRGGDAPMGAARDAFDEWLCRSCGLRWPHERTDEIPSDMSEDPARGVEPAGVRSDASALPGDLVEQLDLHPEEVGQSTGVTPRVGAALRRAREARGLTLSQAAKRTCIWERYLQALEADAPLEEFPAPAYARFFLRSYADFLELEPRAIVREYDEDHPAHELPALEPLPDPRPRRRLVATMLVATSIVSLVSIVLLQSIWGRETGSTAPPPLAPSVAPSGPDPSAMQPLPPAFRGVRAVLRLSQPCWVQAVGDGRLLERSTLQPGDRVVFRAHRLLELTLGNAGAVELEVNGDGFVTGGLGDVVRLELRWRHGEVVSTFV